MAENERPLPKPPKKAFGRQGNFEHEREDAPLMADQIAMAMAEGRLEEFFSKELPDSEHARALATMMMGMTGMASAGGIGPAPSAAVPPGNEEKKEATPEGVPGDVMTAIHAGDVQGLMGLLAREHGRLNPDSAARVPSEPPKEGNADTGAGGKKVVEKDIVEQFLKIAEENSLDLDWLIMRALKTYVEEYRKTGRL
ncbi:MAG TPA: hypothetical protein VF790_06745 [Dissulfurispiraceae bacterium]